MIFLPSAWGWARYVGWDGPKHVIYILSAIAQTPSLPLYFGPCSRVENVACLSLFCTCLFRWDHDVYPLWGPFVVMWSDHFRESVFSSLSVSLVAGCDCASQALTQSDRPKFAAAALGAVYQLVTQVVHTLGGDVAFPELFGPLRSAASKVHSSRIISISIWHPPEVVTRTLYIRFFCVWKSCPTLPPQRLDSSFASRLRRLSRKRVLHYHERCRKYT